MREYVEDPSARPTRRFGDSSPTFLQRGGVLLGRPTVKPATETTSSSAARSGRHLIRPERIGLALILAVSAALNLYGLARARYANTYYAAAVRSMLESWHNFFFVSFDPGGFVSVDKPPLGS